MLQIKKIIISILLLACFYLPLYAVVRETNSDSFTIQAGYGDVIDIDIEAIPAQSAAYIAGMPFDIEEKVVQFDSKTDGGRPIARFNILANTMFKITFDGEPMTYQGEAPEGSTPRDLDYILYFDCNLGVYRNGNIVPLAEETFSYRSSATSKTSWSPSDVITSFDSDSYVGGVDGTIRFMFDEATSRFIGSDENTDSNLPPGTYGATVTVYITSDSAEGGVE